MPLEGHWERQHTPLRVMGRRELRFFGVVAGALVAVAVAAVLWVVLDNGGAKPAAGCIEVTAASTTGGAPVRACGDAAARLCRQHAGREGDFARTVQARCREAGI